MKKTFNIKKTIKSITFLFIFLFIFFFQSNFSILKAIPMDTYKGGLITEELRLKIPNKYKNVWLKAEKEIWEPWLSRQVGFIGRQIFWDKGKEEALILINWENKKLWKSITTREVQEIQEKFDENVKESLNVNENPFKLIYEGELFKQG